MDQLKEISNLTEEVFCLNYELETLAGVLLRGESERWVPGYLYNKTENSHLERYKLAATYASNLKVIDIACGAGKGSRILASEGCAEGVHGFDIDENAIRYAKWRNNLPNLTFEVRDGQDLKTIQQYELAVSFETIEHVPNYKLFLENIKRCLLPNGLFIVSTPISAHQIDYSPGNKYHVQEWGFFEFQKVIKEHFVIEKIFLQLYPEKNSASISLASRVSRRLQRRLGKISGNTAALTQKQFSVIEEYSNSHQINKIGIDRDGYQIIIAKVKK